MWESGSAVAEDTFLFHLEVDSKWTRAVKAIMEVHEPSSEGNKNSPFASISLQKFNFLERRVDLGTRFRVVRKLDQMSESFGFFEGYWAFVPSDEF